MGATRYTVHEKTLAEHWQAEAPILDGGRVVRAWRMLKWSPGLTPASADFLGWRLVGVPSDDDSESLVILLDVFRVAYPLPPEDSGRKLDVYRYQFEEFDRHAFGLPPAEFVEAADKTRWPYNWNEAQKREALKARIRSDLAQDRKTATNAPI